MHIAPVRIAVPEGARRFLGGQVSGSKKDGPNDYGRERDHHTGNYEKQPHDLTVPVKRAGNPSGDIPGRWPSRGSLLSWRKRERQTPRSSRRCSFVPRSATPDGRSRRLTRPRLRHFAVLHCPNAHATMSGNSSRQNASPCDPTRSVMTTSAPAPRRAVAHRVAFSRKKGSDVPATR